MPAYSVAFDAAMPAYSVLLGTLLIIYAFQHKLLTEYSLCKVSFISMKGASIVLDMTANKRQYCSAPRNLVNSPPT